MPSYIVLFRLMKSFKHLPIGQSIHILVAVTSHLQLEYLPVVTKLSQKPTKKRRRSMTTITHTPLVAVLHRVVDLLALLLSSLPEEVWRKGRQRDRASAAIHCLWEQVCLPFIEAVEHLVQLDMYCLH